MKNLLRPFLIALLISGFNCLLQAQDSKGAIIIVSMEGKVTVTNNDTNQSLSEDRVKVGGLLFDGHTVETGKASKVVLLFSSGTITTLKAESVLNIKKFRQESFDPTSTGKLSGRKDEPSVSDTLIDLNLGDMVVDVKKLKKDSSFNIDSPVGTAGIRGTVPAIQVVKLPDGGFNQTTSMLRGEIAFTPKAGGLPTFLGPGQSLSIGIGPTGLMLPMNLGRVDPTVMRSIQREVDQGNSALGGSGGGAEADSSQGSSEEDVPSQDEINESDPEKQASSKGVDDNGTSALALEKAGILDLDDSEKRKKSDTYVEVFDKGATNYANRQEQTQNLSKQGLTLTEDQVSSLVGSLASESYSKESFLESVEDVAGKDFSNFLSAVMGLDGMTEEQFIDRMTANQGDLLGKLASSSVDRKEIRKLRKEYSLDELFVLVSSESELEVWRNDAFVSNLTGNFDDVVDVVEIAEEIGIKNEETFGSLLDSADNAASVKNVVQKASDIGVPQDADNMEGLFKNVDQADSVAKILDAAEANVESSQTDGAALLGPVIRSADQAEKLEEVVNQTESGEVDVGKRMGSLLTVVAKVDAKKTASKKSKANQGNLENQIDPELKTALETIQSGKTATYDNKSYSGIKGIDKLLQVSGADLDNLADLPDSDPLYPLVSFALGIKDELSITSSFDNITDVVELTEAVEDLGLDEAALDNMLAYADQADELNEVVATAKSSGASANLDKVISNPDNAADLKALADRAKNLAGDGAEVDAELLDGLFENAETSDDLNEVVSAVAGDADQGETVDVSNLLQNADKGKELKKLKDEVDKIKDSGDAEAADALLKNVAANADKADVLSEVVDSANTAGASGSVKALIANADKADAIKAAKDKAEQDGASKVGTLFKVIEKVESKKQDTPDPGGEEPEADAFDSLDALVDVADTLAGDGDLGELEVFDDILSNIEQVEQIATALEEDADLVAKLQSSEGPVVNLQEEVQKSAAGKLVEKFPAYKDLINDFLAGNSERAPDLQFILNHPAVVNDDNRKSNFFDNLNKLDDLLAINKSLADDATKVGFVFDNLGTLDLTDLRSVTKDLKYDLPKMNQVFSDLDNLTIYKDLLASYLDQPKRLNKIFENVERLADIHTLALTTFSGKETQISLLFNNLDKTEQLLSIAGRFEGEKRDTILSQVRSLSFNFKNDAAKRDKIFENPEQLGALQELLSRSYVFNDLARVNVVFAYIEQADAFLEVLDDLRGPSGTGSFQILFDDTQNTLENSGLAKLKAQYPVEYHQIFDENKEDAARIAATASKFKSNPSRLDKVFNNIDKLDDINKFSNEFDGDEPRLDIFFNRFEFELPQLKAFKSLSENAGLTGGEAMDAYDAQPLWLILAEADFEYFALLVRSLPEGSQLNEVGYELATELQKIGLSQEEMSEVLSDLLNREPGDEDKPSSNPPENDENRGSSELQTLSFLQDHRFEGSIDPSLVVSMDTAKASSFATDVFATFEDLSGLESGSSDNSPADDFLSAGVLGGSSLEFNSGSYDLSALDFDSLFLAANDTVSVSGNLIFQSKSLDSELIFLSAGELNLSPGSSIDFRGEHLGFGSYDSMEIIEVDLYAQGGISARSLDSLVLNNVNLKSDLNALELLAWNEISIDGLQFINARQISMEAQTINLSNLDFPSGSTVNLNSLYGGLDGKYPNFQSSLLGRVNFLRNVSYARQLIMDRASFDAYGTNVVIGTLSR